MTSLEQNLQQVELKGTGMNWWFGLLPQATILNMDVNGYRVMNLPSPKLTATAPENRPPQNELSSSNHC